MEIVYYIFLAAAMINMGFLLAFCYALFFKTIIKPENPSVKEGVTIVIAAHNEAKNLEHLLPLLLEQDYPHLEIIIVNDRSTDRTRDILERFPSVQHIPIKHTTTGYNSKKNALETGIKAANHDLILLTDADCYPASKHWVSIMTACYKTDNEIVLGLSFYEKRKGLLNTFIQYETMMTAIKYMCFTLLNTPYMGVGRNLSYRKNLFLREGFKGYENNTGGDDDLFVNKHANGKNTQICWAPESKTISYPEEKIKNYLIQKTRHLSVGKKYKLKTRVLLGLEAISSLLLYVFGLILLISSSYQVNTAVIIGIRTVFLLLIFIKFTKLTKQKKQFLGILFEDFSYQLFNWFVGSAAYFRKKIRWK